MADRQIPYGAFNFIVNIQGVTDGQGVSGGFSDVSGLGTEFMIAEYRNGNDTLNRVRKVPGLYKVSDITLKRGLMKASDFWEWINQVRTQGGEARRTVTITLLDESRNPVQKWTIHGALPMKWTGPTLAAKAHGDVAVEEFTLAGEDIKGEAVG